jgi:hypothetical protein
MLQWHANSKLVVLILVFFRVLRVAKLIGCVGVAEASDDLVEIDDEGLDYLLVVVLQKF